MGEKLTEYIAKRDFIRDTFGRYVTMEVVKKLLEDKDALELGGETREVSILMSDIRGFTALTAEMAPEQVIIFLNRYLGKMIEILVDYHAVIDEIVGDGILAFFGAPEPLEDHPLRAVACALQMQAAMDEINFLNEADGLPRLEMGVAVNTGSVVVGNIGSAQRAKYSVVGAHVNFTSRIEASAVGGQVLISSDTYRKVRDSIEVGETLEVGMKGIPKPATLYEVVAIFDPYNLRLKGRSQNLIPLPEPMEVNLYRLSDKIVTGPTHLARITHLGETAAILNYEGSLYEWEDVRLHLLDAGNLEIPGRIYGKVISVKPTGDGFHQAQIRFTSVSPEILPVIRRAAGEA
jgi:class 3 adenylate cyclase